MTPDTDGLAGCTTTARQAQEAATRRAPVTRRGLPSPVTDPRSRAGEGPKAPAVGVSASLASSAGSIHPLAAAMSERELEGHVRRLVKDLGLRAYHTHDARRSPAGFPDWVITGKRTIYRELKREGKKPTEAQQDWLDALAAAGDDADVWRPADLYSGRITRELLAISRLKETRGVS